MSTLCNKRHIKPLKLETEWSTAIDIEAAFDRNLILFQVLAQIRQIFTGTLLNSPDVKQAYRESTGSITSGYI